MTELNEFQDNEIDNLDDNQSLFRKEIWIKYHFGSELFTIGFPKDYDMITSIK